MHLCWFWDSLGIRLMLRPRHRVPLLRQDWIFLVPVKMYKIAIYRWTKFKEASVHVNEKLHLCSFNYSLSYLSSSCFNYLNFSVSYSKFPLVCWQKFLSVCVLISSYKFISSITLGPTPVTSFNLNYCLKSLSMSIVTFWNTVGSVQFNSVQSLNCVLLFVIPWISAHQASLSITNSQSSPKLMCIESVMPSSHLILCRPFVLLPPIPPSIRVFSSESTLRMRWPKYWSFSLSISPSNEHPGLDTFRMDWLDLLAVQGTRKSLLQHHTSKASILQCSAFFTVQLSHPYMTTGKTIALTRRTFVSKVISYSHILKYWGLGFQYMFKFEGTLFGP